MREVADPAIHTLGLLAARPTPDFRCEGREREADLKKGKEEKSI
jgi:hypothetical protein